MKGEISDLRSASCVTDLTGFDSLRPRVSYSTVFHPQPANTLLQISGRVPQPFISNPSPLLLTVMAPEQRGPFSGSARKLVMAFDVGTTYSGASYAVLDPGLVPEIHGVTRYTVLQNLCH